MITFTDLQNSGSVFLFLPQRNAQRPSTAGADAVAAASWSSKLGFCWIRKLDVSGV